MEEKFDLKNTEIDPEAIKILEEDFIHQRKVFPYKVTPREIYLAMVDANDMKTVVQLKTRLKKELYKLKYLKMIFLC